jgi:hypothetical protein
MRNSPDLATLGFSGLRSLAPNHLSLETGGILVGDEVAITLDVEFVKV